MTGEKTPVKMGLFSLSDFNNEKQAFCYVEYCKQNKRKLNESKIDNYDERMQQPLIPDTVKEDFKKINLIMQSITKQSKKQVK